ncbi:hypothetical protein EV06_0858 [Prochlorococcus sp. MIT 0602]|nr:hypothetical protein EV06_0858 [Prochlorococcus sp. MIT 0602]KGG17267.1 hypothetical protein EV07_0705 [Prochlorococcus sp. MIT 0603]
MLQQDGPLILSLENHFLAFIYRNCTSGLCSPIITTKIK